MTVGCVLLEVLLFCHPRRNVIRSLELSFAFPRDRSADHLYGSLLSSLQPFLCLSTVEAFPVFYKLYSESHHLQAWELVFYPSLRASHRAEFNSHRVSFIKVPFCTFGVKPTSLSPPHRSWRIFTGFLSFIVFHFTFKPMIHLCSNEPIVCSQLFSPEISTQKLY